MMRWREDAFRVVKGRERWPVLILGGGINGAGLFRELCLQGVDVLLVDRDDFAAGASSKSSRMVHGGLRYLENAEFRLVRESLLERNLLLDNAPHFVSPLKTTIPLFSWLGGTIRSPLVFLGFPVKTGKRGALVVKLGLALYDFFTRRRRRTPTHYLSSRRESLREIPALNPSIVATATYWDACITQAERLCVELLHDGMAAAPESRALNHVEVHGTAGPDVLLRDRLSGEELRVRPDVVVNATGAWVDVVNRRIGLQTSWMGGTKGSHLVIDDPELLRALEGRMIYYQHEDGRVCIAFAFQGKSILGSTDIRVDDPDEAVCDDAETEYMLETIRGILPPIRVSRDRIVYRFCGVRPLPASRGGPTGKISRDHAIVASEPEGSRPFPILSLVGGKWTTFRALAEQAADRVLPRIGRARRASSANVAIGGGRGYPRDPAQKDRWIARVAAATGATPERVGTLLARYGTTAEAILSTGGRTERPLRTLPTYSVEEIRHVVERDLVVRLTDLIVRRTLIAILGEARGPGVLEELAEVVGEALGWDAERKAAELRDARREIGSAPPAPPRPARAPAGDDDPPGGEVAP